MSWARHKKIIEMAKGYRGRANSCYSVAVNRVQKALQYAYRDRKNKKREIKSFWIQRINAGVREEGMSYSAFMHGMSNTGIGLNRKVLADLAATEPYSFKSITTLIKQQQVSK